MKKIVVAALLGILVIPVVAAAQVDHTGKFAIGYWDPNAPLGGRYVISKKVAVDLGLGFATAKVMDMTAATPEEKTKFQFHVEAGIPITIVGKDKVSFFFRPGFLMKMIPYYYTPDAETTPYESKTAMDFNVSGILGVEWFVTDDFSLSVGHGLQLTSSKGVSMGEAVDSPAEPKTQTLYNGLQALDVTRIGFHFYF